MANVLIFDFMDEDEICSHVEANYDTGIITCKDFTEVVYKTVFGLRPYTFDNLNDFFEERVFDKTRRDADELCEYLGLRNYNPLDICKVTHGLVWGDRQWIRFEGETLKFSEIGDWFKDYISKHSLRGKL